MKKGYLRLIIKCIVFILIPFGTVATVTGCELKDRVEMFIEDHFSDYGDEDWEEDWDEDWDEDWEDEDWDAEPTLAPFDEFSVTPLPTMSPDMEEETVELGEDEIVSGTLSDSDELTNKLRDKKYYAYSTLTDEEQLLYREIYRTLYNFGEKITMPTLDDELIDNVFSCVMADNPEFFYVRGYNLIRYERGGQLKNLAISGLYTMTREQTEAHKKKVDEYVTRCLEGLPNNADDYTKVKYLYDYIINNTEYDLNAENGQNFLSVFENGTSVCQGYSSAMQYLMNKLNMFCVTVRGIATNNENHAWNVVMVDDKYYHLDVTWGDTSYELTMDDSVSSLPELPKVSYEYFCVTTDEIEKNHRLNNYFELPECNSTDANYFVKEGLLYTSVDEAKLSKMFSDAYANGSTMVMVKCSDEIIFEDMRSFLIDDGKVFDYLLDTKNVNYVTLESSNELIFYLETVDDTEETDENYQKVTGQ